ncbi:STAS domain-containing protein [Streptomyces galbus]|jgi:anti-anti-sigma factor|uniref:STAS domain-containing protein n=1 Tax=Streptomyces galbus TaxID=33898 RepID=A0A4U5WZJ9_STRGB|nr:STAS domain-containing protein [Streptomyces galbus]NKQ23513.1 STAS domain-containing protein [Streptomyces galbus]TKT08074.1 STAS domain-containing protein [Streptomyces galbus]GHD42603.1 anti-anti-sigma factor [Streptomyces galbus]
MTTPLTLTPGRRPDGTAQLTAVGEIDMSNAGVLADSLRGTPGRVVLDLTRVEYLDSAALNVLFEHADRLEILAGALLAPVLAVSGIADLATVHTPT